MQAFENEAVRDVYNSYPEDIKSKVLYLRELIFEVASSEVSIKHIEETLKWNEPSYLSKNGSTLRVAYKVSKPMYYSMYFNCKTTLIKTFRELFSDRFTFVGNREIVFHKEDILDIEALKYCILLSLTYHDRKHLAMLDE